MDISTNEVMCDEINLDISDNYNQSHINIKNKGGRKNIELTEIEKYLVEPTAIKEIEKKYTYSDDDMLILKYNRRRLKNRLYARNSRLRLKDKISHKGQQYLVNKYTENQEQKLILYAAHILMIIKNSSSK